MEESPIFTKKALRALILPLIAEQFLAVAVGMADTMMVSSAGEAAVSGISLVDSINFLLIQVFSALATGGAVIASQYIGRRDRENACESARQLLYSITLASLVLMVFSICCNGLILRLIYGNIAPDVMQNAETYFIFSAVSYPFLAIYNAGAALYRSMGNSRISLLVSLLMNVINITGNAVFIFGFQMGVAGAATATLIARIAAAALMIVLICKPVNLIYIRDPLKISLHFGMIRRILSIGIPTGLENGVFQIGKLMVAGLVSTFGTSAIAANAVAGNISGLANIPGAAIGLGMVTVVGQCVGAREYGQAVSYTKKLMALAYASAFVLGVGLFFGCGPLVGMYNLSPTANGMTVQLLQVFAVVDVLFWPAAFALPNALRAAGDAKITMILSILSMWIFRIGCSYLFALTFHMGLSGVWLAMYVDWVVRAAAFIIRFAQGKWKNIHVI
jgi:putative MATE family efflux protein